MKKLFAILLVLAVAFTAFAQGAKEAAPAAKADVAIAMVTDYGDITDQSFNQTTYEACKAFAEKNGLNFKYYKPAGDNTADRVAMIEQAIGEGFNVIVMPGYAFAGAIAEAAPQYKDVKFVGLDVSEYDLVVDAGLTDLSNVYCIVYQEEIAGYLAGYATVKLGYTKLGYCGGMAVPAVIRYGYGFVQGADAAAKELGVDADIQYAYANQFFGDADITAAMDAMYANGAQVVFACGGGVYTSVCEAAAKVGGKAVGVDVAASILANELAMRGVRNISLHDVSVTHPSVIVAEAFRFSHLVFTSTTYNMGIFVNMEIALNDIKAHALQNRKVAVIENGSWAPNSGKLMKEELSSMKNITLLEQGTTLKSSVKENNLADIRALADAIASDLV